MLTLIVSISAPPGPKRNLSSRKKLFLILKLLLVMIAGAVDLSRLLLVLRDVLMILRVQKRSGSDIEVPQGRMLLNVNDDVK